MKRILITSLTFFLVIGFYTSCDDEFLDRTDVTSINTGTFFANEADALAAVNAAYAALQSRNIWARAIFFLFDFASDEISPTGNTQGPPAELLNHTFGPTGNEHVNNVWNGLYQSIAKANIVIANVPDIQEIDATIQAQITGEARFIRALSYMYIVAGYGGGPIRDETNLNDINVPRASLEESYAFIENDLALAIPALPETYDDANVGRATKGAAQALLGRVHLYQGEWAEAEANLDQVINSGIYSLVGEGATTVEEAIAAMRSNHNFGVHLNEEAIFEVQFRAGEGAFAWGQDGRGRAEATIRPREYGIDGFSFYNAKPSETLLNAFEGYGGAFGAGNTAIGARDPRFEAFFFTENDTVSSGPYSDIGVVSGYAWKKYQDGLNAQNPNNPNDNDCSHDVIRFADVVLMSAEAKIQQGKVDEGIALINRIRRRADPTETILADVPSGISQPEALEALIVERQIELCGEQVRRFDLVRFGIASDFIEGYITGRHEVFPIPQDEVDNNAEISANNPGY